jgi:hypothetical protein
VTIPRCLPNSGSPAGRDESYVHAFAPTVWVKFPGKEGFTAADASAQTRYTSLTHELQRNLEAYR